MLKRIVKVKKEKLAARNRKRWAAQLDDMLSKPFPAVAFRKAITNHGKLALIAEFKRKSPTTTIASFINFAILLHKLPRKIGEFRLSPLVDYFTRLVIAAIAGGFVGILLNRLITNALGIDFLAQVLSLGLGGLTAAIVCYITCLLLGVTEAREYVTRLFRR